MKHAREDYMRIQDPENKIGEDEPVFLVRAKDRFSVKAMIAWSDAVRREALKTNDAPLMEMADMVDDHIEATIQWQEDNECRTPDL